MSIRLKRKVENIENNVNKENKQLKLLNDNEIIMKNLKILELQLKEISNVTYADRMKSYMKNKFDFYGIQSVPRRELYNNFRKTVYKPLTEIELINWTKLLWSQPYREYQLIAMDELKLSFKLINENCIIEVEKFILDKSWWDTVDLLASNIIGKYYKSKLIEQLDDYATNNWINSTNMWLNRTAILVQLGYNKDTNTNLLEKSIVPHLSSTEFFHQKAIGWSLREYSKTNKKWVIEFINKHTLKPLSKREAMKHM